MQKVVSISLNGIAYQLEEPGYDQLRTYLERAESRLKDSPDRTEVMADLEQADRREMPRHARSAQDRGEHRAKSERIIDEMGPVESADEKVRRRAGAEGAAERRRHTRARQPRKRLFKIREGAMWAGVCNGIAAYLNVDVTWVRIAFVLLTIFSSGVWFFVYLVLMFVVPVANTAEDRAAAFGMPFNTEELISRAKKNFEEFGSDYRWRREWRRQQRHWNRQWHNERTAAPGHGAGRTGDGPHRARHHAASSCPSRPSSAPCCSSAGRPHHGRRRPIGVVGLGDDPRLWDLCLRVGRRGPRDRVLARAVAHAAPARARRRATVVGCQRRPRGR